MKAKELEFIPVILGGDIATYSLARSFHEEYGIKSIAISTVKNWLNSYSSIIDNIIEPKMNDLDTFLKRLTLLGQQYLGKKKTDPDRMRRLVRTHDHRKQRYFGKILCDPVYPGRTAQQAGAKRQLL